MKFIDMHTHTTASDGSMTPAGIVEYAKAEGLSAIAITDHDTMNGIQEAKNVGAAIGIEVIPGVEIGVEFQPEMHMLGYFFNEDYESLQKVLNRLRENREERNPKIIKKLNELGFDISYEEVVKAANGSVVGRPHIAKVLMDKGYVESIADAFDKYLASGKPAYFKKDKLTPKEGIEEIVKAGGLPVLAHPMYLNKDLNELCELLTELKNYGLAGVEVYYSQQNDELIKEYEKLANRLGLCMTGGSDFHGRFKPDVKLGFAYGEKRIPYELLEKLRSQM